MRRSQIRLARLERLGSREVTIATNTRARGRVSSDRPGSRNRKNRSRVLSRPWGRVPASDRFEVTRPVIPTRSRLLPHSEWLKTVSELLTMPRYYRLWNNAASEGSPPRHY